MFGHAGSRSEVNPNKTSLFSKTNPTRGGAQKPIDKKTLFRDNFSNF